MPNTPALVLKGVSGLSANRYALPEDVQSAQRILAAMGSVVLFEESDLDAVTALSGSGPAYAFFLAESMIEAGITLGLTPENARDLTIGTLKGARRHDGSRKRAARRAAAESHLTGRHNGSGIQGV